jgi:UDP-GlcNAc:undecaprenyl-phosphate GlcNAc-1-phosphate transferase
VSPALTYLLAFAVAGIVSLVLTPVVLRFALRRGVLDRPGAHKSHVTPTPYLGGLAMVVAFTAAVLLAALTRSDPGGRVQLVTLLAVALGMAVIGLLDDLRGLGVIARFGAQLAAALVLWQAGIRVDLTPWPMLDLVITVVWIVGITNAMNLLDNMDGLSAVTATIAALAFGLLGALNGQFLVAALAFALAGCAVGFLRENRPPARIYMGDAGSLFLGILLAALGILLRFETHPFNAAVVPILVLTVPVLDTTLVTIARLRHGISPFQGGRDHTSHRLVHVGLPVGVAVGVIGLAGLAHAWMALIVSRVDVVTAMIAVGLIVTVDALVFALIAKVPVYGNSRGRDLVIVRRATPEGDDAGPRSAEASRPATDGDPPTEDQPSGR